MVVLKKKTHKMALCACFHMWCPAAIDLKYACILDFDSEGLYTPIILISWCPGLRFENKSIQLFLKSSNLKV